MKLTKILLNICPAYDPTPPIFFVLAITDAPKEYDGFGTITVREFGYPLDTPDFRTKHNARTATDLDLTIRSQSTIPNPKATIETAFCIR